MSEIENFPSDKNTLFNDYEYSESSLETETDRDRYNRLSRSIYNASNSYVRTSYSVPLSEVRKEINKADKLVSATLRSIQDDLLDKIDIDPYIDSDLEQAHFTVWEESSKLPANFSLGVTESPKMIPFQEIVFAEKYNSTASRRLIKEYYDAIAHSTFSYVFNFRSILHFIMNEILCIKKSLITDFGGEYENESEQKIATQYYSWSKVATNYAQRITNTITTSPKRIPESELDKISKEQAAQLQTFFAVQLNAVDSEIKDILDNIKRDLVDNCDIFYENYLRPALKLSRDISGPLEIEFTVGRYSESVPTLAAEVFRANNSIAGNFLSVHADYVERVGIFRKKADFLLTLIHEKRKYSNYISQLSSIGVRKKNIIAQNSDDSYSKYYKSLVFDQNKNDTLKSEHARLASLESNDHPQYLLRDRGEITGDITVLPGTTIDGVDIDEHSHNGRDGSKRISAADIDYGSLREGPVDGVYVFKPSSVRIVEFIPDIINGGVPVFDTVIEIEIDDNISGNYNYQILLKEIE